MSQGAAPAAAPSTPTRSRARLRRRGYGWIVWLVAITLVAVGVWRFLRLRQDAPVPVQTVRVERGEVRDFVTSVAAGRVAAKQEATVRAEIAGTVRELHKRRGDTVQAGEPLISYDAGDLKERLRLAQTSVGIVQAQVRQAEQSAIVTQTNLTRAMRLKDSGSIPIAEVENLEGQNLVAQRAIDSARAAVSQALANVGLAQSALSKTVVRAPFAATVLDTQIEVGEATMPGAPIVMLADVSSLHVDAEIDEADLARIRVDMPADVSLDALPGERIRGKVSNIAPSVARDLRGGRSVAIDVELPPDPRLLVGMSADVDVIVAVQAKSLWVPPNAVLGRGADRSVYLVADGVAHKRSIDVGISTWEAVEIRSGLAEGDEVVSTLAAPKLADGVRVRATPAASEK